MTSSFEHRSSDLEQILDVTRHLGAVTELDPLLAMVTSAATRVLNCERATVFLFDRISDELVSRSATGMQDAEIREIRFPAGKGIAGEVCKSGKTINIPDAYADPRFNPEIDRRTGFRTRNMLTFPLSGHEGDIVGVLQVLNQRDGPFGPREEHLVPILGAQAGVAIQRQLLLEHFAEKQRIQRDLNIAREIQQGLLPESDPQLEGFDVAGWNRPADETGGDCYDFMPLADGALAITIADATGHGIGPALVIAEMRALFRATVSQTRDLGQVVTLVNRLLCEDLPDDRFVTAFFGLLAPAESSIRILSAGHGPILRFTAASSEIEEIQPHGIPVGIMGEMDYDAPDEMRFEPGDMLLMFTDGFTEYDRTDGEQFGNDRLFDLIRAHYRKPSAEIIKVVYDAVIAFSQGAPQRDDLTAVIVKKR